MSADTESISPLDQVRLLLSEGKPKEAMEAIQQSRQRSAAMENARAVCLMRLGQAEQALRILRDLVYPRGSLAIPDDTPAMYQANYATALLLTGSVAPAAEIVAAIGDRDNPAVKKARAAIRQWKRSIGLAGRLAFLLGVQPNRAVRLEFPPGDA